MNSSPDDLTRRGIAAVLRIPRAQWPLVALRVVDDSVRIVPRGQLLAELRAADLGDVERAMRRTPPRANAVIVFENLARGVRLSEFVVGHAEPRSLWSNLEET